MRRLHLIAGSAIVTAWVMTVGKGVLTDDWQGLALTTPVMLIFAGYLFGDSLLRKRFADD